jgi:hypothetical protein
MIGSLDKMAIFALQRSSDAGTVFDPVSIDF